MRVPRVSPCVLLAIGFAWGTPAWAAPAGDVTGDGKIDVSDVQCAIVAVLWSIAGSGAPPACLASGIEAADINCDDTVQISDALLTINYVLGVPPPSVIDDNGDGVVDACQGSAPCCVPWGGVGCLDADVEACVCAADPFCCAAVWDPSCAAQAAGCGADCPSTCGNGACGAAESCVSCPDDCGLCPAKCGDGSCNPSGGESCAKCPEDCGACSGDCCASTLTPWCGSGEVLGCVCALDPACCVLAWDSLCVAVAEAACGLDCPPKCGDGVCDAGETCESCPSDCGICGCGDGYCKVELGEWCWTCPNDCGKCLTDCCAASPEPGCQDPTVQDCVCAQEPACCSAGWGAQCATLAAGSCGYACDSVCGDGVCKEGESCTSCPVDCGACGGRCGDGACKLGESCDTCPLDCGACTGSCCEARPEPGCEDSGVRACVCASDPACCLAGWDAQCVQIAGDCGATCGAGGAQ
jgi:hypothetical protein